VKERLKKIENYHVDIPEEGRKYISPKEAGEYVLRKSELSLLFQAMGLR
jgi:hypothetical protein